MLLLAPGPLNPPSPWKHQEAYIHLFDRLCGHQPNQRRQPRQHASGMRPAAHNLLQSIGNGIKDATELPTAIPRIFASASPLASTSPRFAMRRCPIAPHSCKSSFQRNYATCLLEPATTLITLQSINSGVHEWCQPAPHLQGRVMSFIEKALRN